MNIVSVKKSVDKLVEECIENVDAARITEITEVKCRSSCTIYVVIIAIVFTICNGTGTYCSLSLVFKN